MIIWKIRCTSSWFLGLKFSGKQSLVGFQDFDFFHLGLLPQNKSYNKVNGQKDVQSCCKLTKTFKRKAKQFLLGEPIDG